MESTHRAAAVTLALFDFDGTITRKDTFVDFLRTAAHPLRLYPALVVVVPLWLLHRVRLLSVSPIKAFLIFAAFKGWSARAFEEQGRRYATERLPHLLNPVLVDRIGFHQSRRHRVVVVTASATEWIAPWCTEHGIELISTQVEKRHNRLTGRFLGKDCRGAEKARRVRETIDLAAAGYIYAYGDSPDDREMLALAHERYWCRKGALQCESR
jgi:phosphatidylglycerophosphatase C